MENMEEMDKSFERYNFPRLNQEEIENINRPNTTMSKEKTKHRNSKIGQTENKSQVAVCKDENEIFK